MADKKIKELKVQNVVLTQEPKAFTDKETGNVIDYFEYVLKISGFDILVKGVNAKAKVRLDDLFEKLPEIKVS